MQMVTEEKFSLLFKTHFTIGGELEATLNVSSLSPFSSSLFPPLLPICLPKFLLSCVFYRHSPSLPQALSLPVVVIVHVTQQPPAEATIFWDNSFAANVS